MILGGVFFNSDVFIQACIVPIFFVIRATFEYGAKRMTSKTFGSDGLPIIGFLGVGASFSLSPIHTHKHTQH